MVKDGDFAVQSIENTEVATRKPEELAVGVAEILGADPQATHDAMVQADSVVEANHDSSGVGAHEGGQDADSMSVEAEGPSYMEYGERIGATLNLDGEIVARAIAQAYEELYGVTRDVRDNGSGQDAEGKEDPGKLPAEPPAANPCESRDAGLGTGTGASPASPWDSTRVRSGQFLEKLQAAHGMERNWLKTKNEVTSAVSLPRIQWPTRGSQHAPNQHQLQGR